MSTPRLAPGPAAFATMVLLCAIWGMQQIAVKVAITDIPPIMQSGLRSLFAALLVFAWSRWRGIVLFGRDGSLWPGLLAGALFAAEFACVYTGVNFTTVSRLVVFLYSAPCLTVLALHIFVRGESMQGRQALGVALAFAGLLAAFADRAGGGSWLGDALGVLAAIFWAATTVVLRATGLGRIAPAKVLFYQLAVSAVTMFPLSLALGEHAIAVPSAPTLWAMLFQSIVVAFVSYLIWFWLLARYLAGPLMVFSFLTPLFGVLFGVVLLGDRPGPYFYSAAALVVAGIVLVNLRGRT